MNSGQMSPEELSSLPPRPPGHATGLLPASSPKRRFVKLRRKTSENGSLQSGSSGSSTRSHESVAVAVRQPSRSRIRRHTNRLSGVFQRGSAPNSAPMSLTGDGRSSLPGYARKDSLTPVDLSVTEDPSELSNQITAPGILKIFGSEICEGAHYKSVLATTHSSAKELVKEALERYGLSKQEAESYVLCDAIGHVGEHQWRMECFRVVGDNEKPLLLQSLWKPREGLARRFEIQRRSTVEEKRAREKDTVTAGINAQARKLQKSRSRVTSTLMERALGRGHSLWRSLSELDLSDQTPASAPQSHTQGHGPEKELEENHQEGQVWNQDENLGKNPQEESVPEPCRKEGMERAPAEVEKRGAREGEGWEREETESSDDSVTQYFIHPPHDCPYLLLLRGYSLTQDFVIYLLGGSSTVIGRHRGDGEVSKVDVQLSGPDIQPRHCCLRRRGNGSSTWLRPFGCAVATRNGEAVSEEAELGSGDVIGLGGHYLFLFKDPTGLVTPPQDVNSATPDRSLATAPWLSSCASTPPPAELLCSTCSSSAPSPGPQGPQHPQTPRHAQTTPRRAPPYLKDPWGQYLTLHYSTQHEERVVAEIVAMAGAGEERPSLSVAFLLCLCLQYSAARLHTSDLRRLLLLTASQVQNAMWEHTKELAAGQSEGKGSDPEEQPGLSVAELLSALRPLVVWMSNALELLNFIQHQLPPLLAWRSRREQQEVGKEEEELEENIALLEMRLSCVRSASEETMTVLEEVIMLTFQQCVYYLTKALYPILPGLLECNPFKGSGKQPMPRQSEQFLGSGGLLVPGETEQVLEVLKETRQLLQDCQLHQEISSQLLAYLFYFINASLFNKLMERGSESGFYQWSRGVSVRANLDLLLDWAHASGPGLGELVLEHTHTLSSAVNLLATPRESLVQAPWTTLRSEFPSLSPAQLHHLLAGYSPPPPCPHAWTPALQDRLEADNTAGVLESFDSHPPLLLPGRGFILELGRVVGDPALREQLDTLRAFVCSLSGSHTPGETPLQGSVPAPLEAKLVKMAALPKACLQPLETPPAEKLLSQVSLQGSPPPGSPGTGLDSCGDILTQKLRSLELQSREMQPGGVRRSGLDPSCLLTPPNTPHSLEPLDPETEHPYGGRGREGQPPWSSFTSGDHQEDDVFEEDFLSADCTDSSLLGEEVEEADQEVFTLELQRGERGLGLALVDARDTPLRMSGIFIRSVVPDSPAARSRRLGPGDRILAVNGVSLVGLDYHRGKELIQGSGERPRLLVARSDWTAKAIQTPC
ncbi:ras-associating and dilute domain-containing protein-like [Hypomesus transpacificus]|uniref:ras-associating and dilute domain-containing protein-like n=1 Tax=Hypomesus transpacificus TaxID=137520 RepID=UPI001F0828F1|nr:ras-associating and dilute domain-containing protein-like [Hypomesus transpacificus]